MDHSDNQEEDFYLRLQSLINDDANDDDAIDYLGESCSESQLENFLEKESLDYQNRKSRDDFMEVDEQSNVLENFLFSTFKIGEKSTNEKSENLVNADEDEPSPNDPQEPSDEQGNEVSEHFTKKKRQRTRDDNDLKSCLTSLVKFIFNFTNLCLKEFLSKFNEYKFLNTKILEDGVLNKSILSSLLQKNIGDFLKEKQNDKYKNKSENLNAIVFDKVNKEPRLPKFLDDFFKMSLKEAGQKYFTMNKQKMSGFLGIKKSSVKIEFFEDYLERIKKKYDADRMREVKKIMENEVLGCGLTYFVRD